MGLFVEYTPIGDLVVLSLCLVVFILIYSSYISRTKSFVIFFAILCAICGASLCDVFFHFALFFFLVVAFALSSREVPSAFLVKLVIGGDGFF